MSKEENKAIVTRMYEEIHNNGNLNKAEELVTSDFVDRTPAMPDMPKGPEGVKLLFGTLRSAFPDLHTTVEDMVSEDDRVVARLTMRGTHKGEFMGIPATGKEISISGIDIVRLSKGKVAERWGVADIAGMMQQLGVGPTPGQ
ncbi:MAG: ester cyclase [Thermoplasmata archaeon]|nr:MAG: ester cyclase [Thermoplasmata archaeon]